jgi:hypothetical protein
VDLEGIKELRAMNHYVSGLQHIVIGNRTFQIMPRDKPIPKTLGARFLTREHIQVLLAPIIKRLKPVQVLEVGAGKGWQAALLAKELEIPIAAIDNKDASHVAPEGDFLDEVLIGDVFELEPEPTRTVFLLIYPFTFAGKNNQLKEPWFCRLLDQHPGAILVVVSAHGDPTSSSIGVPQEYYRGEVRNKKNETNQLKKWGQLKEEFDLDEDSRESEFLTKLVHISTEKLRPIKCLLQIAVFSTMPISIQGLSHFPKEERAKRQRQFLRFFLAQSIQAPNMRAYIEQVLQTHRAKDQPAGV